MSLGSLLGACRAAAARLHIKPRLVPSMHISHAWCAAGSQLACVGEQQAASQRGQRFSPGGKSSSACCAGLGCCACCVLSMVASRASNCTGCSALYGRCRTEHPRGRRCERFSRRSTNLGTSGTSLPSQAGLLVSPLTPCSARRLAAFVLALGHLAPSASLNPRTRVSLISCRSVPMPKRRLMLGKVLGAAGYVSQRPRPSWFLQDTRY